jgi:glycosyltransferase involved in cell wall biosynthesis
MENIATPTLTSKSDGQIPTTIAFFLSSLATGGAERQTLQLRQYFRDQGHRVPLFIYGTHRQETMLNLAGQEDVVFFNIKGKPTFQKINEMRRAFLKMKLDLLVTVNMTSNIVAVAIKKIFNLNFPIVNVFHSTVLEKKDRLRLAAFRLSLRKTDELIFVSKLQAVYWKLNRLNCKNISVIQNGVDLDHFRSNEKSRIQTRARLAIADQTILISLVAAFRPEKNHRQLLRILHSLKQAGKNAKILFVGDGPTMAEAKQTCAALGLNDDVNFTGNQSDVVPYLCATDIGVLCSTTIETFSLSALENLACGVPMVMSETGGAAEIIENGVNGFLFKVSDDAAMLYAINKLLDADVRRQCRTMARRSVEKFAIDVMQRGYKDVFMRIIDRHAAAR